MKMEISEDIEKMEYVYKFTLPKQELAMIKFDRFDSTFIEQATKTESNMCEKLIALEIIARRAKEQLTPRETENEQV